MTTQTPDPSAPSRGSSRVISTLTIALGAAVLVGAVWGGAVPTVASALTRPDDSQIVNVDGVTEIDVDVSATDFTIEFGDVDTATLSVEGASGRWTLERDVDTLIVESPRLRWFWFGFGSRSGTAVLTLPTDLAGVDADISTSAGSITVDGEFGELDLEMSAGDLTATGSADSLSSDVSAGRADIDLEGVREAELSQSAGETFARLTGTAPREVSISVSAGSLDLTVPDEEYDVTTDTSAGSVDNGLSTSSSAERSIHVDLSAGSVTLSAD